VPIVITENTSGFIGLSAFLFFGLSKKLLFFQHTGTGAFNPFWILELGKLKKLSKRGVKPIKSIKSSDFWR